MNECGDIEFELFLIVYAVWTLSVCGDPIFDPDPADSGSVAIDIVCTLSVECIYNENY